MLPRGMLQDVGLLNCPYRLHGYCTFTEIMCHLYVRPVLCMPVLCSVMVHCLFHAVAKVWLEQDPS